MPGIWYPVGYLANAGYLARYLVSGKILKMAGYQVKLDIRPNPNQNSPSVAFTIIFLFLSEFYQDMTMKDKLIYNPNEDKQNNLLRHL